MACTVCDMYSMWHVQYVTCTVCGWFHTLCLLIIVHVFICRQTGGINFGPEDAGNLWACADALKKHNVPYSVLNADEMNRRFPILNLPPNYKCVMEKDAGILRAPNALKAYQVCVCVCACACVCVCVCVCVCACACPNLHLPQ